MIIIRLIFFFLVNLAALLVINQLVPGVELVTETSVLITTALIFTALNSYLRPLIRYFLTTFIILTLGLLGFAINAGTLYLLDFITENIPTQGTAFVITGANDMVYNDVMHKNSIYLEETSFELEHNSLQVAKESAGIYKIKLN